MVGLNKSINFFALISCPNALLFVNVPPTDYYFLNMLHNRINGEELKERLRTSEEQRTTLSFYRYIRLENPVDFRDELYRAWHELGLLGRIYVAPEGINAQVSVPNSQLEKFKNHLQSTSQLQNLRLNVAIDDDGKSFFKLKIQVKNKIVADGIDDPTFNASDRGQHLNAAQFNALTDEPDTILVDMRNHYESEVGHFENAVLPDAVTFREELAVVEKMLENQTDKKIVMYCTGGIRCEKASAYMKHKGFKNVFQLDGGIIEYARQVKAEGLKNKFRGKNFVFDERLGERISDEIIARCHQCGNPSDTHRNCANDACNLLFIQCDACAAKYESCCSEKCKNFINLPEDKQKLLQKNEIFNGIKFGKGRYKAPQSRENNLV